MLNNSVLKTATLLVAAFLLTVGITSCKKEKYSGEKSPGTGAVTEQEENWFIPKNHDFSTMKAKVSLSISALSFFNIKTTVSVERGKRLMISMQPLLGIEMYRVTCTQDSIIFIDKMLRSYVAEPYRYFTDKNFNLNYEMIEGLMCNLYFDPLKQNYKSLTIKEMGADSVFHCQAPNYYVEFFVQNNINRTLFSTNDGTEYVMADYNTFQNIGGYTFPMAAVCTLSSQKLTFSANIGFDEVEFNVPVTIVSNIPGSYKKSSLESLLK